MFARLHQYWEQLGWMLDISSQDSFMAILDHAFMLKQQ